MGLSLRPPLTLLLGPAGSGKTAECLRRLRAADGRALLIVPTKPCATHLQQRVKDVEGAEDAILTFGELVVRLASADGTKKEAIRRTFQRLLLADLFEREIGPDDYFGKMRRTPGFVGALAESIRELKLSGIAPDDLEAGAQAAALKEEGSKQALHSSFFILHPLPDDPNFARKTAEIVRLYRAYETFLREHDLYDEEDLPRVAAARLAAGGPLPREAQCVLVDGFYRLSFLWRHLLAALARRDVEVVVTLPYEKSRSLLFATPARTLELLREEFIAAEVVLPAPPPDSRPVPLHVLERGLFGVSETAGERVPDHPLPRSPAPPITLFDAPNPYVEVEMIARALRREHDERGTPWGQCAIFLRSLGNYAPILTGVCSKYGIPLAMGQAQIVADNPLIKTILALFRVFVHDWQRDDVIAFLKSSYTATDKLRADALRRRAHRRGLREGREGWARMAADRKESGDPLGEMLEQMLAYDALLRPRPRAAAEFVSDIGLMIEEFQLKKRSQQGEPAQILADKHALEQACHALNEIASAAHLTGRGPMRFEEFYREALATWRAATYCPPPDPQAVAVLEPYDARQRDAKFAAVMGLTERVFPRRVTEDPFFRDDERAALREAVGLNLEGQRERADDERLLFYLAVTAPTERLILSFPRSADEADTLPSFYLDEVRALFDHMPTETRTLADVAPRPQECVTDRDRLLAACASLSAEIQNPESRIENPNVRAVVASRHRPRVPRLIEEALRRAFATPHRYNISEIETYNTCPFQYLMRYGLRLRPEPDGGGPADRGTVYHAVLRRQFRQRAKSPETPDAEALRQALQAELEACLEDHPVDALPYRRRMMERALADALAGFAGREEIFSRLFGMTPTYFELAFGQEAEALLEDEEIAPEARRDYDPASTSQPLLIPSADGGPPIQICGAIDRVDLAEDGQCALVMDYKLGASVEYAAIKKGWRIQLPLYLMAIEQLWGKIGAVACYDSPRDKGRRRFFRREHVDQQRFRPVAGVEDGRMVKIVNPDEHAEMMQAAQEAVRRAVAGIAAANVLPTPGPHCAYCAYSDVCRTSRDNVHDGEPLEVVEDPSSGSRVSPCYGDPPGPGHAR